MSREGNRIPQKFSSKMQSLLRKGAAFLTPTSSTTSLSKTLPGSNFVTAPTTTALFPTVDPAVDGEDCDHDCASCTISYPRKFSIEEGDKLYGHIKGWSTHMLVATGKTDWVRDVADEKGSVMEAVDKAGQQLANGKLMLSASNMPLPDDHQQDDEAQGEKVSKKGKPTTVLLLPAMTVIDSVSPGDVPELLSRLVSTAVTTTTPIREPPSSKRTNEIAATTSRSSPSTTGPPSPSQSTTPTDSSLLPPVVYLPPSNNTLSLPTTPSPTKFSTHACPHRAVILLCSQKTRDARCGQSAPLLCREFERHLRPLGLYRDLHDQRPGGVGIYFISHVGGHKYSANVMVYRRKKMQHDHGDDENKEEEEEDGAVQGIWLARVRPVDCEGIIKYTVLKGKVVKPEKQLRGGFDRQKGLVSW